MHSNLVATGPQIKFGKNGGTLQLMQQIFYDWYGKFVFDSQGIQLSEISTQSPGFVFFGDRQSRRRVGTCALSNFLVVKKFLDHFLNHILLCMGHSIWPDVRWCGTLF
jgi:hypothetical protein